MTRRVVDSAMLEERTFVGVKTILNGDDGHIWAGFQKEDELSPIYIKCPYGKPGDSLWVRETWCPTLDGKSVAYYRSSIDPRLKDEPTWKPSVFMPRWASRITLKVTSVRLERLQEITPDDCIREGVNWVETGPNFADITGAFRDLWGSINGKRGYGWDSNPYVWVVSFERVEVAA